jgi:Membrane transporters of cations and cationic drugs
MAPATTAWIVLIVAGLFESGWAIGLRYSDNFTKLWPSVLTLVSMAISVYMLSWSLKILPVGTGYAVWTGIGSVCTAILGIYLFEESTAVARLLCLGLIVAGIAGLKIVS